MAALVCLLLLLALTGHSSALYCICKDGVGDSVLQKNIDYACGSGADCTQIRQSGACYNPNTIKDHCNYAVNSYYQKRSSLGATCDFGGTATTSSTIPAQSSGCSFASSSSTSTPTSTSTTTSTTTTSGNSPSVFNTGTGLAPTGINDTSRAAPCQSSHLVILTLALSFFWFSGLLLLWG